MDAPYSWREPLVNIFLGLVTRHRHVCILIMRDELSLVVRMNELNSQAHVELNPHIHTCTHTHTHITQPPLPPLPPPPPPDRYLRAHKLNDKQQKLVDRLKERLRRKENLLTEVERIKAKEVGVEMSLMVALLMALVVSVIMYLIMALVMVSKLRTKYR